MDNKVTLAPVENKWNSKKRYWLWL